MKTINNKTMWFLKNNTRYENCNFEIDFVEHVKGSVFMNCCFEGEGVCIEFIENCRFMNCSFVEFIVEQAEKSTIKGGHMQCLRLSNLDSANKNFDFIQTHNIKDIHLDGCELEKIPEAVLNIKNLRKLYLPDNNIAKLEGIQKLANLLELHIDSNNIRRVSDEICTLQKLKILSMSNNRIELLPDEVSKLQNLQILHLEGNAIAEEHQEHLKKTLPNCTIHF